MYWKAVCKTHQLEDIFMHEENAIEVRDVYKSFKIYLDKGSTFKERAIFSNRRKYEDRQVLKGISFDVKKGEAIGLIGHNGCGKSTTLKLLTRIMYPDKGEIEMKGRVSSLIELGAGFHPDMSGRENIYINASIFGLGKKEIDERIEDIIAFSELEDFIDNPVRTYSSGMYMRLAFAVAINVDADILLIDEILAVGDAGFQSKCFNKLRQIKAEGTTIVIVSHSLGQVEQICDRSIWIHEGKIKAEGVPKDVHPMYLDYMGEKRKEIAERERKRKEEKQRIEGAAKKRITAEEENSNNADDKNDLKPENVFDIQEENTEKDNSLEIRVEGEDEYISEEEAAKLQELNNEMRWGNGFARIESIKLLNLLGEDRRVFRTGEGMTVEISIKVHHVVKDAVIGIAFNRFDGMLCAGTNTRIDHVNNFDLNKDIKIAINIPRLDLLPGEYDIDLAIEQGEEGVPVDYYRHCCDFEMVSAVNDVGVIRINHSWIIEDKELHTELENEMALCKYEVSDGFLDMEYAEAGTFRWTGKKKAAFVIKGIKNSKQIGIPYFINKNVIKQSDDFKLSIWVDGKNKKVFDITQDNGIIIIELPEEHGYSAMIEMETSFLWSPCDVLDSQDDRLLGIAIVFSGIYSE